MGMTVVISGCQLAQTFECQRVTGEPFVFSGTVPREPLHPVDHGIAFYSYADDGRRVSFREGKDYASGPGGFHRVAGSAIYDFASHASGKIITKQVYADYCADIQPVTIPALAPHPIIGPIFAAGDSVTAAADTIGLTFFDTDADGYVGLLREQLKGANEVSNISESGVSLLFLENSLTDILAQNPGALVIAFGRNDHANGVSAVGDFSTRLAAVVDQAIAHGVHVVLVGFIVRYDDPPAAQVYNDAIEAVAVQRGLPFIDISSLLNGLAPAKSLSDVMADNGQHPNNWGQRLYFSAILPHLISQPVSSALVPAYVAIP